jgi:MinD-like ATPase involved in chromosome partitioning or flagellar assembly
MAPVQDQSFQLFTCRNSKLIRNLGWLLPFSEDLWNRIVTSTATDDDNAHAHRVSVVGIHEGDGASTVAYGLAHYLCETLGYRTCVLEADLRAPASQNDGLAPNGSIGLKGFLSGECGIDEVIFHVDPLGFHDLPSGPTIASPTALINEKSLQSTLETLEGLFDVVIVDSPALNNGPENRAILSAVEASVLVLKSGRIQPAQAAFWLGKVQEYGGKVGALCLNGVKFGLPSFLRNLL